MSTLMLVVVAAGPSATAEAAPVPSTCRGLVATIVGDPDSYDPLVGTEGPDVVITNGVWEVDTLGGADVVCVTGDGSEVDAGAGDDVVDASASGFAGVALGAGADEYVGSRGSDTVIAGDGDPWVSENDLTGMVNVDTEREVIRTGLGDDTVVTGQDGHVSDDVIDLGGGGDLALLGGPMSPAGLLDGGSARYVDTLIQSVPSQATDSFVVDNALGVSAADGVAYAQWSGFEAFSFTWSSSGARITFLGGPGPEDLEIGFYGQVAPAVVDLGGGDDSFSFYEPHTDLEQYDGGPGRDSFTLDFSIEYALDSVRVARFDLAAERARLDGDALRISGFEEIGGLARRVRVIGTSAAESFGFLAGHVRIEAGGGADRIVSEVPEGCARLLGQGGNDRIRVSARRIVALGGRGYDRVHGVIDRGGSARCVAEIVRCRAT